jgi:hypothetical protein
MSFSRILPVKERAELVHRLLERRLREVLPVAMRENGLDCWLIVCQEDNLDPVYTTMIPMDTWCPILQILVFFDLGDRIEGFNLSGTNTHRLYQRPDVGQLEAKQWSELNRLLVELDPLRIGINTGSVQWAAGGLTLNLYRQLHEKLPVRYTERFVSAEDAAIRWLTTLSDDDLAAYEHVCAVGHALIAACYSRETIVPGYTSIHDLPWAYWQLAADRGMTMAFKPYFRLIRGPQNRRRYGEEDAIIRPGDMIHCDVGVKYLGLNSDHQQVAYVLKPGETDAPGELHALFAEAGRLQDLYMNSFEVGISGDALLKRVLDRAREAGIPTPKVYSHSVGLFLHEPGPLIGLPWEQESNPGRGDVHVVANSCFTMELSVQAPVAAWGDEEVRMPLEEVIAFDGAFCRPLDGRQLRLQLI